jgi:hypothetical protein
MRRWESEMALIETASRSGPHSEQAGVIRRVLALVGRLAATWWCEICTGDEAADDPTASFSAREWADLPTHHPASDE